MIKDEEWAKLKQLLPLPPEARSELDDYIGYCRELRLDASRTKYGDLWFKTLCKVIKTEEDSKEALDGMIAKQDFFDAIAMGLDGQEKIPVKELKVIRKWLRHVSAEKRRLLKWYKEALQRVHNSRTGQRTGRAALVQFMNDLNRCLIRHTKTPISTGKGNELEFLVSVCKIAFPDLQEPYPRRIEKKSSEEDRAYRRVKKAIEPVLKEYLAGEVSHEIRPWQHLIPDWKPATNLVLDEKGVQIYFCEHDGGFEWNVNGENTKATDLKFPSQPFISDEVAARQSKLPPRLRSGVPDRLKPYALQKRATGSPLKSLQKKRRRQS